METTLHAYVETIQLVQLAGVDLAITRADHDAVAELAGKWKGLGTERGPVPDLSAFETFEIELAMLSNNLELWEALSRLQALSHSARTEPSERLREALVNLLQALGDRKRAAARKALTSYVSVAFGLDMAAPPSIADVASASLQHNDDSVINRVYAHIRGKLISFELRPGERLREQELADEVESSRLSVREVLSRLVAEKIAVWEANRGFSVRSLRAEEIFQLFELRRCLESHMVALAIVRSTSAEREEFVEAWQVASRDLSTIDSSMHIREDEAFHERIARMARNPILTRELDTIASRIHFVRGIDLRQSTLDWADEHDAISRAVLAADGQAASAAMESHLARLFEDVRAALKIGVSELYLQ